MDGWRKGAWRWIATQEKERRRKKEGRRAGGRKGCWRRVMRKARERGRETGAQCYRCIRVKLVLSSSSSASSSLETTPHSLAALFHEPNRFRNCTPLPSPPSFPHPHLHPYPHAYVHATYVCIQFG